MRLKAEVYIWQNECFVVWVWYLDPYLLHPWLVDCSNTVQSRLVVLVSLPVVSPAFFIASQYDFFVSFCFQGYTGLANFSQFLGHYIFRLLFITSRYSMHGDICVFFLVMVLIFYDGLEVSTLLCHTCRYSFLEFKTTFRIIIRMDQCALFA